MDLSKLAIFNMASKRMDWLNQRQKVLAQNVANSDTPKFVPHDLKPQRFGSAMAREVRQANMTTTNSGHLEPTRRKSEHRQDENKQNYEVAPAGNAVVLEEQLMRISETQADHRLVTNLYQKHLGMLRAALGRNR